MPDTWHFSESHFMPRHDLRLILCLPLSAMVAACVLPASAPIPGEAGVPLVLVADARITEGMTAPVTGKAQRYDLPTLIDLAQRNNPRTRAAWERARQAAAAVGLVDSTYLPRISAEILAGANRGSSAAAQDPLGILPAGTVDTTAGVGAAVISIQWLLFDFGVRDASRKVASEVSLAANIGVSGVHQALIHEVTQAYYTLEAASAREAIQSHRLAAAKEIAAMVSARRAQELATVTATAQADQLVAQARFDLTRAQSETAVASTRLATLAGFSPGTRITPAGRSGGALPSAPPARLDSFLKEALQRRPDLQTAFARARASRAGVEAVEAAFRPKIVASAAFGHTMLDGSVRDDRIGGISGGTDRSVAGVYVGVSIPLWDGNARKLRRDAALADASAADTEADQLRRLAEGEIIAAYETLKAALAAHAAADELVATAQTTYDAARSMADQGLATVAEVDTALKMLYDAEIARVEAAHSARSSAALLAFACGQIGAG